MTPQQLAEATGARIDRAGDNLAWIAAAMDTFEINTPARQAAFLAQIGHESAGFKFIFEIWGPTGAQQRYEVRGAGDLGNVHPGDGFRYRGRGWIQLTGRDNYRRAYQRMVDRFGDVPNFEEDPDAVATSRWASMTAAEFWFNAGCNQLADEGKFESITKKINGGLNGYADRLARWSDAKDALA